MTSERARRNVGDSLQEAAARSTKVGDEEMSSDIRWIRSYVLKEDGGRSARPDPEPAHV